MTLCGAASYEAFKHDHKILVEECLRADKQARDEKWTQSVAAGSQDYVERIKTMDELLKNMREVIELCLEDQGDTESILEFVGVQKVSIDDKLAHA